MKLSLHNSPSAWLDDYIKRFVLYSQANDPGLGCAGTCLGQASGGVCI